MFFHDELRAALLRLNPGVVTAENISSVIAEIEAAPPTIEGNKQLLEWLRGQRTTFVASEKRSRNVRLIDFAAPLAPGRNVFQVTVEWAFRQQWKKGNRPDVVFLINGVPVALIECKNPKLKGAMEKALVQLRRYEKETPEMLVAPQVFNLTHLIEYFYGVTWTTERKGVFNWRHDYAAAKAGLTAEYVQQESVPSYTTDGDLAPGEILPLAAESPAAAAPPTSYGEHVRTFFDRERFLTLLRE